MKALSWILVFWPLAFAICIIIATELSNEPVHTEGDAVQISHKVASGSIKQVSDTAGYDVQSLAGETPVRP